MKWFLFHRNELLLMQAPDGTYSVPQGDSCPVHALDEACINTICGVATARIESQDYRPLTAIPLRQSFFLINKADYRMAGKCAELLYWNENTLFCSACGGKMEKSSEISKRCSQCGREVWPLLATAVIVRITRTSPGSPIRNDEILLVHAKTFKRDFQSHVAGFVETGERLEETVYREVMEEVGLKIKNLQYFGSQSWPYPCGLMVAFTAEYNSGEIRLQETELTKAQWYRKDQLPELPDKASIARQMIDDWADTQVLPQ